MHGAVFEPVASLVLEAFDNSEDLKAGPGRLVLTGFPSLDLALRGESCADFVVLDVPCGAAATQLSIEIAVRNILGEQGQTRADDYLWYVYLLSMRVNKLALAKALAERLPVPPSGLSDSLYDKSERLKEWKLLLCDEAGVANRDLLNEVLRPSIKPTGSRPGIVIIDGPECLDLRHIWDPRSMEWTRNLPEIARTFGCAVIGITARDGSEREQEHREFVLAQAETLLRRHVESTTALGVPGCGTFELMRHRTLPRQYVITAPNEVP